MIFSALNRCLLLAAGVGALVSCSEPVGLSGSSASSDVACEGSPELITDPLFATINEVAVSGDTASMRALNLFRSRPKTVF